MRTTLIYLLLFCLLPIFSTAQDKTEEQGDLILLSVESVTPGHYADYIQWGKDYKAVADKTNFRTFWVGSSNGLYTYAINVGKNLSGVTDYEKEWDAWTKANPELKEQYKKYHHSISHIKRELWRHSPKDSYTPEGYVAPEASSYIRTYQGLVSFGSEEAINGLLTEFKEAWTKAQVSQPYSIYWNVFGKDGACIAVRTVYKERAAWLAEQEEVGKKVGGEKLNDLFSRWNKHIRAWEETETSPQPDLTHFKK